MRIEVNVSERRICYPVLEALWQDSLLFWRAHFIFSITRYPLSVKLKINQKRISGHVIIVKVMTIIVNHQEIMAKFVNIIVNRKKSTLEKRDNSQNRADNSQAPEDNSQTCESNGQSTKNGFRGM